MAAGVRLFILEVDYQTVKSLCKCILHKSKANASANIGTDTGMYDTVLPLEDFKFCFNFVTFGK